MRSLLLLPLCALTLCGQDLALVHARIYTDPDAAPISDGAIIVRDGWIRAVGRSVDIQVPPNTRVIDCTGLTALAGFWNSHVHFTQDKWWNAQSAPTARLAAQLVEMLLSHGFTAAFDTGSDTANTIALRERIGKGEVPGPMVLTAGTPMVPENGTPYYLLPEKLPELRTPDDGRRQVRERYNLGVDAIKIISGSWISKEKTIAMPVSIVDAVTAEAHRFGLPVFAHPSDPAGLQSAVDGAADILAHAEEVPGIIDSATMARMHDRNIALIPTLKLFSRDETLPNILRQVKTYRDSGGQILFGTDAGFLTDYDPTAEYQLMAQAGFSFSQILASLTTEPAARFGYAGRKGRLLSGMDADIVLIGGDPSDSASFLADIRLCVRGGAILYDRRKP